MTPDQTERVKRSWRSLQPDVDAFTKAFYASLFDLQPGLRALFFNDMGAQRRKLADTLSMIVEHLDDPVTLMPRVHALGVQHAGYGVRSEHYALVERALIVALARCLPDGLDDETERAWQLAYRALADAMAMAEVDAMMYPR